MSNKHVEAPRPKSGRVIIVAGLIAGVIVGLSPPASAAPAIQVDPTSGPGASQVTVTGTGFEVGCSISISFLDVNGASTLIDTFDGVVSFQKQEVIPASAAVGTGTVVAGELHPWRGHCYLFPKLIASAQFTVTGSTQLLGNPGFESGSANPAPWVTTARINDTSAEPSHSGSWDAWLGGNGTAHQDSLYQDVAIPSGVTSTTLVFWLHVDTADTGSTAHDLMKLQVRSTSNTVLATLATYSNLDAASGYAQKSFDLTSFAGQTVRVYLGSREDAALQTSFVVDDFSLPTN